MSITHLPQCVSSLYSLPLTWHHLVEPYNHMDFNMQTPFWLLVWFSGLVCSFHLSGVSGQSCHRVTYTDRSICVFRGSSAVISCTYSSYESVTSTFWFSPDRSHQWKNPSQPEDLSKDSQYAGRVQLFDTRKGHSILTISDLSESDSAQYHFTFKTRSFEWGNNLPGTTLTVTGTDEHKLMTSECGE